MQNFANEFDEAKQPIENNKIRKLYRILRMPTADLIREKKTAVCETCSGGKKICVSECRGFKSIMLKSVSYTSERIRDELIKIAMFCNETEISCFVNSFDDIQQLFNRFSPHV